MTSCAQRLWALMPSLASMQRTVDLAMARQPAFEWINRDDHADFTAGLGEARDGLGRSLGQVTGRDLSGAPMPRWRCTDPTFAPDLMFEAELFASRRLRDAMRLDDGAVQWLDVDCSDCPPVMQAADYRLMNLLAFANPIDRERSSPPMFEDVVLPNGSTTFVWTAPPYQPGGMISRVLWRTDFVPPAPLFRVPGGVWTLATDQLAERVMRAGIKDAVFMDFENDGTRGEGTGIIYRDA